MDPISQEQFNIAPSNLSDLQHLSTLLHLFHTRNKNQHRHSVWYRHSDIFRRQLSLLTQELTALNTIPASHSARVQKKKLSDPISILRIQARLTHWSDALARKWQRAFSQLLADQRFAVLGLFLLAVLAQVCCIGGITAEWEEMGEVEVRRAIEAFGREARREVEGEEEGSGLRHDGKAAGEDAGQVVSREGEEVEALALLPGVDDRGDGRSVGASWKRKSEGMADVKQQKEKKKKKRKKVGGDAIDDIFG